MVKPKKEKEGKKSEEKGKAPGKKFSKEEKQILIVVLFMVAALIGFLVFFFIYKNAGAFVYNGIRFQKANVKGLMLYYGKVQMKGLAGTVNYNLFLRNDPRIAGEIPANGMYVKFSKALYISFEPKISQCYGSNIAAYELASFLNALGIKVTGATTSHEVAIDEGVPERTCADATNTTIILLQTANQTFIEQRGDCYIINIANCNTVQASEGFMLSAIKDLWNIAAS
jgi:hypothetical protein